MGSFSSFIQLKMDELIIFIHHLLIFSSPSLVVLSLVVISWAIISFLVLLSSLVYIQNQE
jgi:hypothetical protein